MPFSERKGHIAENITAEKLKIVCLLNQSDCSTRQRALSIEQPMVMAALFNKSSPKVVEYEEFEITVGF